MLFKEVRRFWRLSARRSRLFGFLSIGNWSTLEAWSHSPKLVCHVPEVAKVPPAHESGEEETPGGQDHTRGRDLHMTLSSSVGGIPRGCLYVQGCTPICE